MLSVLLAATLAAAPAQDGPPPPSGSGMLMRADSNGDGVVTREEHLAQAAERFDRMDANRDGRLTADEMPRFGQRQRGMRGGITPPPAQ